MAMNLISEGDALPLTRCAFINRERSEHSEVLRVGSEWLYRLVQSTATGSASEQDLKTSLCSLRSLFKEVFASDLDDQHCVAVGIEPVSLFNCDTIGAHSQVITGKCSDEHHQRRPRQVKIRQQMIHRFESIRRANEDPRVA